MLALRQPESIVSTDSASAHFTDGRWLEYFSRRKAIAAVAAHVAALPSSSTPERHTHHVYESGLKYWLNWAGDTLPTEDIVTGYIAHLRQRGLKSSTIGSKYLAPLRLYLRKLAGQHVVATGAVREFVEDCRLSIRSASEVPTPRKETSSNRSALYQHGTRLTVSQVNEVFLAIEADTIAGARDRALLYLGFTSGMRLAELARITLAKIYRGDDCYELRVRGKRNNVDPVPVDSTAVRLIHAYVDAYNAPLEGDDPRRITPTTPIWQPLLHGDNHAHVGNNRYDPSRGLSAQGIRDIIARRTESALGKSIAPHDMRRTVAAIGRANGMDYDELRVLLRHRSISTTATYVGNPPNMGKSLISNRVQFEVGVN